jgi:PIN domain nuclease of toxin-antitoxin system
MHFLLDTHTLLWFLEDDPQLSEKVKKEIVNINNRCFVSIASLWEIAIKIKIGKLTIKFSFEKFAEFLSENDIEMLPISLDHLVQLLNMDFHHRDPFDRIIIAQGHIEQFTIITRDVHFASYTDRVMWK